VTGGVYLMARSGTLFAMAPAASLLVTVVGAITAFFAATIGLTQWDIKKVLAYSTVSQLGYMFIAAGVGAYSAAVFHLATHAFFKALLFLGAGSVIYAMHEAFHHTHRDDDAQDMRNMGGLRKYMPVTFVLMWAATLAIAGIPPLAGFFSKDLILGSVFERAHGGPIAELHVLGIPGSAILYAIYVLGLATAVITAVYMTRMMIYTFHGPNRTGHHEAEHLHEAPWVMTGPLVVLGVLTVAGGWLNIPHILHWLGPVGALDHWLEPVVGAASRQLAGSEAAMPASTEWMLVALAVAGSTIGIVYAVMRFRPERLRDKTESLTLPETGLERSVEHAYYVDAGIRRTIVEPVVNISRKLLWRGLDVGLIDGVFVNGSAALMRAVSWAGSRMQTGNVSNYAWVVALGAIVLVGVVAFR
jgi:NADH-quinone oxidoreductase subunit L